MWLEVTLIVAVFVTVSSSDSPGQCRKPPFVKFAVLQNQYLIQQSFSVGQVVSYKCLPGYSWNESTPNFVVCQANLTWSEPSISCMPKDCGLPKDLENGYYTASGQTFGETTTYYCNKGYQLLGKSQILCTSHGWSKSSSFCDFLPDHEEQLSIPSTVTNPINPMNEAAVLIRSPTTDGAASQSFPSLPSFLPDHEEQLSIPSTVTNPINPMNEAAVLIRSPTTDGAASQSFPSLPSSVPEYKDQPSIPSTVISTMNTVYKTTAQTSILTTDGSETNHVSKSLVGYQCQKPPFVKSAALMDLYQVQQSFSVGQVVSYECLPGYNWNESTPNFVVCQANLTWSEPLMSCMPKNCGPPKELENGYYIVSGQTFGETATYYCNIGYQLLGKSRILCTIRGWSRSFPFCEHTTTYEQNQTDRSMNTSVNAVINKTMPPNKPQIPTDNFEKRLILPSAPTNASHINWPLLIPLGLLLVIAPAITKIIFDRRKCGSYKTGSQFPEHHKDVELTRTNHN